MWGVFPDHQALSDNSGRLSAPLKPGAWAEGQMPQVEDPVPQHCSRHPAVTNCTCRLSPASDQADRTSHVKQDRKQRSCLVSNAPKGPAPETVTVAQGDQADRAHGLKRDRTAASWPVGKAASAQPTP